MQLLDEQDVQQMLCEHLKRRRKLAKLSRQALAERSGVPTATIQQFETTGQMSLRQFLRLWLALDDLNRLAALTQTADTARPATISEVLNNAL